MFFKKSTEISFVFLEMLLIPQSKFDNFKPSFHTFFYSGLFCFKYLTCFYLLVILSGGISLQVQIELYIYYLNYDPDYFVKYGLYLCSVTSLHVCTMNLDTPRILHHKIVPEKMFFSTQSHELF